MADVAGLRIGDGVPMRWFVIYSKRSQARPAGTKITARFESGAVRTRSVSLGGNELILCGYDTISQRFEKQPPDNPVCGKDGLYL
jgi:hypothetical protein